MELHHFPALGTHVKLGRVAPPSDRPKVALSKYATAALPAPPSTVAWGTKVPTFPMYANDEYGDCTCAAAGHMIQCWTSHGSSLFTPASSAITDAYWATGDHQDTGRVETDVLNYWHTQGIAGHKIAAYASVNPLNVTEVKQAAWLFGGLYIGIALPLTAQSQSYWKVVNGGYNSEPGSWGGHAVNVTAYTSTYLTVATWGMRMKMSWGFWKKYVDEAYAIISPDWIKANGQADSGYDLAALQRDLSNLT